MGAVIESAVNWAVKIANDNSHGYDQNSRWGPNYDCSSLVISAFEQAGYKVKSGGATYIGNMKSVFLRYGFSDVTSKIALSTGMGLKRGDVLLNTKSHTALVVEDGGKTIVNASINENGKTTGGRSGDQTGREIYTRGYYNYPWDVVLRYNESASSSSSASQSSSSSDKEYSLSDSFGTGDICCKTNEITIKGGIQITGNKLVSGDKSNVYLRENKTLNVENPYTEAEDGVIRANIGVAIEGESSNIVAANEKDYSGCFVADLPEEEVYYDTSDNIVKLDGTYTITFDYGDGAYYGTANRGDRVAETEKIPTREGYYFGGWYSGNAAYDFTKPVYSNMTLTANWLAAGTFGISITPSKIYIVSDKATAYGAAHKGGILTDVVTQDIVDYGVINLYNINLDLRNADTISLYIWDENQKPLCNKLTYPITVSE